MHLRLNESPIRIILALNRYWKWWFNARIIITQHIMQGRRVFINLPYS